MCLLCLKEVQKYWRINNNVLDLFLQYLDRSIAERLHGTETGAARGAASAVVKRPELADTARLTPNSASHRDFGADVDISAPHQPENLFEDQYFSLVNGHWEGDDALGDLGLFLQAEDFSQGEGLDMLGRSL